MTKAKKKPNAKRSNSEQMNTDLKYPVNLLALFEACDSLWQNDLANSLLQIFGNGMRQQMNDVMCQHIFEYLKFAATKRCCGEYRITETQAEAIKIES